MGEEIRETRSNVQTDRDLFKATLPFGVESADRQGPFQGNLAVRC